MDFSDHLRRKVGKAVYSDYYQKGIINSYICSNSPSNNVCVSDIKPKSFVDAYNIGNGASQGGCSYSNIISGSFTYVPKCPPTKYSNLTR
jgi:hypothetical protein